MGIRTLIVSHLVVLGVGVYAGRELNADELSTYRGAYESPWSRLRRQAGSLTIGAVAVGGLVLVVRLATRRRKD
jgi:hypothetical protein